MQCSVQVCSVQELWHAYDYDLSYGMSRVLHRSYRVPSVV